MIQVLQQAADPAERSAHASRQLVANFQINDGCLRPFEVFAMGERSFLNLNCQRLLKKNLRSPKAIAQYTEAVQDVYFEPFHFILLGDQSIHLAYK